VAHRSNLCCSSSNSNRPFHSPSFTKPFSSSGSPRLATTIKSLPDDVLLEIFDIYRLDEVPPTSDLPWEWHTLAHVCKSWRDIIFSSPHRLNLELLCTYGTPVRKNLGYLPVLPIVIYFPFRIKESDEDNIVAVLEHPDRVRVVDLYAPCSVLGKMAAVMQGHFPALTCLSLESTEDGIMPGFSDGFLGGGAPRLQKIDFNSIPFPAALAPLLSARDLVDISLRDISNPLSISVETLVLSLGTLPGLELLTLGFRWGPPYPVPIRQHPIRRTVLPALTIFYFEGFLEYLEQFVAQIDAPQLYSLGIEYSDEEHVADYQIPQLCKFFDRSEKLKLSWCRRMDLKVEFGTVIIDLFHEDKFLSVFQLAVQDEGINQVLGQICPMLSNVDRLFVISNHSETEYNHLADRILWLQLLRPFTAVKVLSVQNALSPHVAFALQSVTGERAAEVLPALELLCLQDFSQPMAYVEEFVEARRNVGRPVTFINQLRELQERLESG